MASPQPPPGEASAAADEDLPQSVLQFTVLYGSHTSAGPVCYLLEVSGTVILLDCGWDENWDVALLEPLERVAQDIKVILVSHPDINHIGALPYAYKKFKLKAPCYVTSPVLRFGHLSMYDAVLSGSAPYSLDDVDFAVSKMSELKFQQPLELKLGEDKENIKVFAYASGRSLGGALWRVSQEPNLNVVYATDVLQRGERFWGGLMLEQLRKSLAGKSPSLLIQDIIGISLANVTKKQREDRERELVNLTLATLRKGGDVLISVDSVSRVLEVLLLLDETWVAQNLVQTYDLVFLTRVSSVLDVASSHIEWASDRLQKRLDANNAASPFQTGRFIVVDSVRAAFERGGPRVVVCAGPDLAKGSFGRDVFTRYMANRPNSLVILTMQSLVQDSVGQQLQSGNRRVEMMDERLVDLEGPELEEWERKRRVKEEEREREIVTEAELVDFVQEDQAAAAAGMAAALTGVQDMASSKDALALQPATVSKPSLSLWAKKLGGTDEDGAVPMFSFADEDDGRRWDEYGGFIDIAALLDDESRIAMEAVAAERTAIVDPETVQQSPSSATKEDLSMKTTAENEDDLGPRKKIAVRVAVDVLCQVRFIDMDGRAGGKDLIEIVNQMKPSKLVVVRSTLPLSEKFAKDCHEAAAVGAASAPAPGECLDVVANSAVVRVRLPDETLNACPPSVKLSNSVLHVRRVHGRMALLSMAAEQSAAEGRKRRMVVGAGSELPSILPDLSQAGLEGETYWITKGEATLLSVADAIKAAGLKVLFKEGNVLRCGPDEDVCVHKAPQGNRLVVSGPISDVYFQVRKLVYGSFSLI